MTDNSLVISCFNFKKSFNTNTTVTSRCLNKKNLDCIKDSLSAILSGFHFSKSPVNTNWQNIKDVINSVIDNIAPLKPRNIRAVKNVPWFDDELVKLGRLRNKYFKKSRSENINKNQENSIFYWKKFQHFKNLFLSYFKKKKFKYYNNFIDNCSSSSAKLWKKLNMYINPNSKSKLSATLILDNPSSNTDTDLANYFVNFFASITNSFNFLPINICLKFINDNFFTHLNLNSNTSFHFNIITVKEVEDCLRKLSDKTAAGSVGIDAKVLKHCATELSPFFTQLFNQCLNTSEIPKEWKVAFLTPIFKNKGSKKDLSNYRPISVLSPLAKIFESLLSNQINSYFESNNIFNKAQFGFRKKLSCELALNNLLNDWRKNLSKRSYVISIFLDLSKAFDTINHTLLIIKLKLYNFDDNAIKLINDYLADRFIVVTINGIQSKKEPLNIGVPQGSVLGPLLFIIFVNDMCYLPVISKSILFADDTTISFANDNIQKLIDTLKNDIVIVCRWLEHNHLIINLPKTNAMFFNYEFRPKELPVLELKIGDTSIEFVESFRLLGVIIDNKFNFDNHINKILKSVNSKTYLFNRNLKIFSEKFRITLFKLFIVPNFDYCSTTFFFISTTSQKRLEKCFTKSLKTLTKINLTNYDLNQQFLVLSKLNILPLPIRYFLRLCSLILTIFFNNKLELNNELLMHKKPNLARKYNFRIPSVIAPVYRNSFITTSLKILNEFLYQNILDNQNDNDGLIKIKKKLRTEIFMYYNTCLKIWSNG